MRTAIARVMPWAKHHPHPDDGPRHPAAVDPGPRDPPRTIAQLAMPSPDDSSPSGSSTASHEPFDRPTSEPFDRPNTGNSFNFSLPRRPNRLRKPPPTSYPLFSFVPENPPPVANFPYIFNRSAPSTPVPGSPQRPMSVASDLRPSAVRKLTKRRNTVPAPPPPSNMSMPHLPHLSHSLPPPVPPLPPHLRRRGTFSLRRRKSNPTEVPPIDNHPPLPTLPPQSPLALNIPMLRPFHARRRDSWHQQQPAAQRHSEPTPTDFAEVAWTGAIPRGFNSVMGGATGGWKSTWSLGVPPARPRPKKTPPQFTLDDEVESPRSTSPTRPPFLRREAATASPKRRWTLAMALTDEGISDEMLVEKLEALRSRSRVGSYASTDDPEETDWDRVWSACDEDDEDEDTDAPPPLPPKDTEGFAHRTVSMPALPTTATWQSARRALLTCRELVRTERHYLASLQLLLSGHTRAAPPPLMLAYAHNLVHESTRLLARMEEDPSAWGVAAAFLGAEEGLEAALVSWCGVVGGWFADAPPKARRLSKIRGASPGAEEGESPPKEKRRHSWRSPRRGSSGSVPTQSLDGHGPPPPSPVATATFLARRRERELERGRPAVRDLAILPTQRIMRYVLLYRDLFEHTPASSPSRALVERAVEAAMGIAQRCDRAQGNAAFLQRRHCLISFMSMFMFCYAPKRKFTTLTAFLRPGANVPHAHARHAHTHARASAPLPTRPHAPPI
ncbi:hypothetical protein B0H15DRAFT_1017053 [Mycena belliarum]|uniref:DH domain-containing protein n=1 Tax=Mycena belliarum TaxID=1033014 RepID=A0AAD6UP41_9AGAR|nr:hypothetical protein B0H15DRAFT_1017053 [Mycena belliae]